MFKSVKVIVETERLETSGLLNAINEKYFWRIAPILLLNGIFFGMTKI